MVEISCFCDILYNLNRFVCSEVKEKYDLKVSEVMLLDYLGRHPSTTMTTLARFLDISPSTMTSQIDTLIKKQLVDRIYSEDNRREVYIKTTRKAEKILLELNMQIHAKLSKRFSDIESQELVKLITKLNEPI